MILLALLLLLMCENVNAAPQAGPAPYTPAIAVGDPDKPAVAAPFTLSHPLCTTGFMLSQRIDTRDRFDWIVKRRWIVTHCANGRIVYGRKV